MATFIDTLGVLEYFAPLFAAVLVFAVVFALLIKTKVLGENKVVSGIIAIILGILVLVIPNLVKLINFVAPWFVLIFIFLVLLLTTYRTFGMSEHNILEYVLHDKPINWTIFAVGLIILVIGIFNVYGQQALELTQGESSDSEFQSNVIDVVFSPQMLGLLLVFAIAIFTVAFLGGEGP
ncbi:hypothetical protein HY497_00615 [Candidatus Woesearchaeota archaeon]|nr:hypothetical protein [Candidatus Woesearchaeota archaeon]